MKTFDVIGMCMRNLVKRKLRTFLTLLGVMIGTGSIILMISLGLATDAQFARMIEDMSLDMTAIRVWPQWGGTMWLPDGTTVQLEQRDITDDTTRRILAIPGVQVATPFMQGSVLLRTGRYVMEARVTGITPEAMAAMGMQTSYGRLLEEGDGFAAVFGAAAERHFFDHTGNQWWSNRFWEDMMGEGEYLVDVINAPIRMYYDTNHFFRNMWRGGDDDFGVDIEDAFRVVRSFDLNVVGVLEPDRMDPWNNGTIYMDIELLQTILQLGQESQIRAWEEDEWNPRFTAAIGGPRATYDEMFVRAVSMDDTRAVAEAIREMGYQAHFQGDFIDHQRQSQQAIQTLLAAIAAISLFVAAINIANTMITSVTERTREIGIMKVIGASLGDVRRLFLTEAAFIGMLGGLFGVGLALAGSYALNNLEIEFLERLNVGGVGQMGVASDAAISLITPWLVGVALLVASGVGLVSGFYPAWHATRLSALAAIRNE